MSVQYEKNQPVTMQIEEEALQNDRTQKYMEAYALFHQKCPEMRKHRKNGKSTFFRIQFVIFLLLAGVLCYLYVTKPGVQSLFKQWINQGLHIFTKIKPTKFITEVRSFL